MGNHGRKVMEHEIDRVPCRRDERPLHVEPEIAHAGKHAVDHGSRREIRHDRPCHAYDGEHDGKRVADPVLYGPFEQKRHGIRPLVRWFVFHLGFPFVLRHRMRPSLLREKVSLDLRHTSITLLSLTRRKRRKIPEEPAAFAIALPRAQPYEEDLPVRMCSKPAWKKSA